MVAGDVRGRPKVLQAHDQPMNPTVTAIVQGLQTELDKRTQKLSRSDYYEVVEELKAHCQCLLDCKKEEDGE